MTSRNANTSVDAEKNTESTNDNTVDMDSSTDSVDSKEQQIPSNASIDTTLSMETTGPLENQDAEVVGDSAQNDPSTEDPHVEELLRGDIEGSFIGTIHDTQTFTNSTADTRSNRASRRSRLQTANSPKVVSNEVDVLENVPEKFVAQSNTKQRKHKKYIVEGPHTWENFFAAVGPLIAHRFAWGVASTVLTSILGFTAFGGLFLDIYSNIAPASDVSGEVTMVTIGPETLYLWNSEEPDPDVTPRALLAELVGILEEVGAKTIVLDVLLTSSEQGDDLLAMAAQKHGAVIGAEQSVIDQPRNRRLFAAGITPELQGTKTPIIHSAHANLFFTEPILFTGDLIFRGVPLVQFYQRSSVHGVWPDTIVGAREEVISPSLSLAGAWLHKARMENPDITFAELLQELHEACVVEEGQLHCGKSKLSFLPDTHVLFHDNYWLHHLGSESNDKMAFVSASSLLLLAAERATFKKFLGAGLDEKDLPKTVFPEDIREKLQNKLVIIGRVDRLHEELADRYPTTYSFPLFSKKDMAGMRIQAQLMEALISGRHLRILPGWTEWVFGAIGIWLSLILFTRTNVVWHLPIWVLGVIVLSLGGVGVFVFFDGLVIELGVAMTCSIVTLVWAHLWYKWSMIEEVVEE